MKDIRILSENVHLVVKFSIYLNRRVFVMRAQGWFHTNTYMQFNIK